MDEYKFPYKWWLKDGYPAKGITKHNSKVFGTFICGGGSSMGYKLAGYEHLGGVEIDPKVAAIYKANHKSKYLFIEDIRVFNQREDLPKKLYDLDILDGSPPCSSFSLAGSREKAWGKNKVFKEGQKKQRLDDLVFEYVKTIKKLRPKVALLENVKGLIQGNAKAYAKKINKEFTKAGYNVQLFLLNAASMGVPQKRERVFFIGLRNDFDLPKLKLDFNEKPIAFRFIENLFGDLFSPNAEMLKGINWCIKNNEPDFGKYYESFGKRKGFSRRLIFEKNVCDTLTSQNQHDLFKERDKAGLTDSEAIQVGSYPLDYNFNGSLPQYLVGMSVPPIMIAQIANQINLQWLKNIR
jgi:DNA (cytosine-5)-methyltransferase 1